MAQWSLFVDGIRPSCFLNAEDGSWIIVTEPQQVEWNGNCALVEHAHFMRAYSATELQTLCGHLPRRRASYVDGKLSIEPRRHPDVAECFLVWFGREGTIRAVTDSPTNDASEWFRFSLPYHDAIVTAKLIHPPSVNPVVIR